MYTLNSNLYSALITKTSALSWSSFLTKFITVLAVLFYKLTKETMLSVKWRKLYTRVVTTGSKCSFNMIIISQ